MRTVLKTEMIHRNNKYWYFNIVNNKTSYSDTTLVEISNPWLQYTVDVDTLEVQKLAKVRRDIPKFVYKKIVEMIGEIK